MLDKKAQATSIIVFVGVLIMLLFMAPMILKVVNGITSGVSTGLNATMPQASAQVTAVSGKLTGFWDYVILSIFAFNILALLITSFLVDIHPAFLVIYVISLFTLFLIGPSMTDVAQTIYSDSAFTTETAQMPATAWLLNNFWTVMIVVALLSGLIAYGKFRMGSGGGQGY